MRISDWSSDVCSSDLRDRARVAPAPFEAGDPAGQEAREHPAVSHDEQETPPAEAAEAIAAPAKPVLRVVNSDATPEEIAALVAVFSALGSGGAEAPAPTPSAWSANHRRVRRSLPHGPGAWRSSGLPS